MAITAEIKTLLSTIPNVTTGSMPTTPDNSITIYPTGGYARSLSGTYLEEPTVQIKVRNASYVAGELQCDTVKDLLHGKSTTSVLMIEQQSDTLSLGKDANNRSEFAMNFRCYYRR